MGHALGLRESDKINQPGKLFVIIGRSTFSAAMFLVGDLEEHTRAIFIGEPTGGKPNHFGSKRAWRRPSGITANSDLWPPGPGHLENRLVIALHIFQPAGA